MLYLTCASLFFISGLIDRSPDDDSPKSPLPIDKPFELVQKDFDLSDACDFARCAMEVKFLTKFFPLWDYFIFSLQSNCICQHLLVLQVSTSSKTHLN